MTSNDRITNRQLIALILLDLFGTATALMPKAAEGAGRDAWAASVLASLMAALAVWVYAGLARGVTVGRFVAVTMFIRLVVGAGFRLRLAAGVVREAMLPKTAGWLVCACVVIVCWYAAAKGLEARARLAELLAPLCLLAVFLGLLCAVKGFDVNKLTSVMDDKGGVWRGALRSLQAFGGVELAAFMFPYMSNAKGFRKAAALAVLAAGLLAAAATAAATARFGFSETALKAFPVIDMLDAAAPMAERLSALFGALWVVSGVMAVSAALWFCARFFGGRRLALVLAAICVFAAAQWDLGVYEAWIGLAVLPLPFLVWIAGKVRRAWR